MQMAVMVVTSRREAQVVVAGNALIFLFAAHSPLLSMGIAGRLLWTAAVLNALLLVISTTAIYILHHG